MATQRLSRIINGDGCLDEFYALLWMKPEENDQVIYPFRLPHTVTFNEGKASGWYFSDSDGKLLRKNSVHISLDNILEAFTKNPSRSGIAAFFFYHKEPGYQPTRSATKEANNQQITSTPKQALSRGSVKTAGNDLPLYIEYISIEMLEEFLLGSEQRCDGVLQAFIDPEYEQNTIIECLWSPALCLYEKRVNKRSLYDTRFDLYERAVTVDGSEVYSTIEKLKSPNTAREIADSLNQIHNHVQEITFHKYTISRMRVYFKVDKKQQLWLLWCNSIRSTIELSTLAHHNNDIYKDLVFRRRLRNTPLGLALPRGEQHDKKRIFSLYNRHPVEVLKTKTCFRCEKKQCKIDMIDTTLGLFVKNYLATTPEEHAQSIIKAEQSIEIQLYDRDKRQPNIKKISSLKIPIEIQKIFPNFGQKEFQSYANNPNFLNKPIEICIDCYLELVACEKQVAGIRKQDYLQPQELKERSPHLDTLARNVFNQPQIRGNIARLQQQQVKQLYSRLYKAPHQLDSAQLISKTSMVEAMKYQENFSPDSQVIATTKHSRTLSEKIITNHAPIFLLSRLDRQKSLHQTPQSLQEGIQAVQDVAAAAFSQASALKLKTMPNKLLHNQLSSSLSQRQESSTMRGDSRSTLPQEFQLPSQRVLTTAPTFAKFCSDARESNGFQKLEIQRMSAFSLYKEACEKSEYTTLKETQSLASSPCPSPAFQAKKLFNSTVNNQQANSINSLKGSSTSRSGFESKQLIENSVYTSGKSKLIESLQKRYQMLLRKNIAQTRSKFYKAV